MNKTGFTALLFYASTAAIYTISSLREFTPEIEEECFKRGMNGSLTFGGKYKYLTLLNMVTSFIVFKMSIN